MLACFQAKPFETFLLHSQNSFLWWTHLVSWLLFGISNLTIKNQTQGFPVVQQLRLLSFQCRAYRLTPGLGTKVPHAQWYGQEAKINKNKNPNHSHLSKSCSFASLHHLSKWKYNPFQSLKAKTLGSQPAYSITSQLILPSNPGSLSEIYSRWMSFSHHLHCYHPGGLMVSMLLPLFPTVYCQR